MSAALGLVLTILTALTYLEPTTAPANQDGVRLDPRRVWVSWQVFSSTYFNVFWAGCLDTSHVLGCLLLRSLSLYILLIILLVYNFVPLRESLPTRLKTWKENYNRNRLFFQTSMNANQEVSLTVTSMLTVSTCRDPSGVCVNGLSEGRATRATVTVRILNSVITLFIWETMFNLLVGQHAKI